MRNFPLGIGYLHAQFEGRGSGKLAQNCKKRRKSEPKNRYFASVIQSHNLILRHLRLVYETCVLAKYQTPSSKRLGGVLLTRVSNMAGKWNFGRPPSSDKLLNTFASESVVNIGDE